MNYAKYLIKYFLCIGTLLTATIVTAWTQQLSAKASLDTSFLLIGDQTKYRIEVEKVPDIEVQLPLFSDTLTGGIEILNHEPADTQLTAEGMQKISSSYLVTSFDSGFYMIPPVAIPFRDGDFMDTVFTAPVFMSVFSIPVDTTNRIFDIKPPMEAPLTLGEMLPVASLVVLAIIVILFLAYFISRIRKKKPVLARRVIEIPPHQEAFAKLEKLREEKLWQQGKVKEYYTVLTDIVRFYIERRFNIRAMEQTSYEILSSFETVKIKNREVIIQLQELLQLADMVKFAKELPPPGENEKNIGNAYAFVRNTMFTSDEEKPEDELTEIDNTEVK